MISGRQSQDQQERLFKDFYELSALVLNIIRPAPPPADRPQITPAGFAYLLLGISVSLMLCGSMTFLIGFILMPWVIGLVVCLYFAGVVTSISMIGKAIFCWNSAPPPPSPRKDAASWKLKIL